MADRQICCRQTGVARNESRRFILKWSHDSWLDDPIRTPDMRQTLKARPAATARLHQSCPRRAIVMITVIGRAQHNSAPNNDAMPRKYTQLTVPAFQDSSLSCSIHLSTRLASLSLSRHIATAIMPLQKEREANRFTRPGAMRFEPSDPLRASLGTRSRGARAGRRAATESCVLACPRPRPGAPRRA